MNKNEKVQNETLKFHNFLNNLGRDCPLTYMNEKEGSRTPLHPAVSTLGHFVRGQSNGYHVGFVEAQVSWHFSQSPTRVTVSSSF